MTDPIPSEMAQAGLTSDTRLCDVDGDMLESLSPAQRAAAVDMLVQRVRLCSRRWPRSLLELKLEVPAGLQLSDLDLSARTFNALGRVGLDGELARLSERTLGDLMAVRGFGAACIVELLWALEWACARLTLQSEVPARSVRRFNSTEIAGELDAVLADVAMGPVALCAPCEELDEAVFAAGCALRRMSAHVRDQLAELEALSQMATAVRDSEHLDRLAVSDPRLGHMVRNLVPVPDPSKDARARLERACAVAARDAHMRPTVLGAILRLRDAMKECEALTLEEEFDALHLRCSDREKRIYLERIGWQAASAPTLEALGERYGVTRERIRQICAKVTNCFDGAPPYAPVLDRALAYVAAVVPDRVSDVECRLRSTGIASSPVQLHALVKLASHLGRSQPGFVLDGPLVVPATAAGASRPCSAIISAARKAVSHWGVSTFVEVAASVDLGPSMDEMTSLVEAVLRTEPGFLLLDDDGGWFVFMDGGRNPMLTRLRKILSVCSPISLAELRAGLARHYRAQGFAPPTRVLRAYCEALDGCTVSGSFVSANSPLSWRSVLSRVEATMVAILLERGGVLPRHDFEEACVAAGLNRSTFYVYLDYSPVLCRYAPGVYGLRGVDVPPGVVDRLRTRRRRTKTLLECGWTDGGRVRVTYQLSESLINSGVFSIPRGMREILDGRYSLTAADGASIGQLVVQADNPSSWGLGPLFRRRGGEPGDYLILEFDLSEKLVVAQLGDESLLDVDDNEPATG